MREFAVGALQFRFGPVGFKTDKSRCVVDVCRHSVLPSVRSLILLCSTKF
jgi:hypothetical protein